MRTGTKIRTGISNAFSVRSVHLISNIKYIENKMKRLTFLCRFTHSHTFFIRWTIFPLFCEPNDQWSGILDQSADGYSPHYFTNSFLLFAHTQHTHTHRNPSWAMSPAEYFVDAYEMKIKTKKDITTFEANIFLTQIEILLKITFAKKCVYMPF